MRTALLRVVACTSAAVAVGAWQSPSQAPVFRAGVHAVPVHVSVTDAAGEPVRGLTREDFVVLDDGQPAEIVAFGTDVFPVAMSYLISKSQAIARYQSGARSVGLGLIDGVRERDRLSVGTFGRPLGPFTGDRAVLAKDLDRVIRQPPSSMPEIGVFSGWVSLLFATTALGIPDFFDRLVQQGKIDTSLFWQAPDRQLWPPGAESLTRSVVYASHGMDSSDQSTAEMAARHSDSAIRFGLVVFGFGFEGEKRDQWLKRLSVESGGRFIEVAGNTDVRLEAGRIMADLKSRYLIGFAPARIDGTKHRLEVRLKAPRPDVTVRARSFYVPAPQK
jgi:hypothetical protein